MPPQVMTSHGPSMPAFQEEGGNDADFNKGPPINPLPSEAGSTSSLPAAATTTPTSPAAPVAPQPSPAPSVFRRPSLKATGFAAGTSGAAGPQTQAPPAPPKKTAPKKAAPKRPSMLKEKKEALAATGVVSNDAKKGVEERAVAEAEKGAESIRKDRGAIEAEIQGWKAKMVQAVGPTYVLFFLYLLLATPTVSNHARSPQINPGGEGRVRGGCELQRKNWRTHQINCR